MSVYERRMEIIEILCVQRHSTIANLAFELGVSVDTVKRDIQFLSLSYPVYTTQGNGGGVHIMDGYKLYKKYLTDKQSEYLKELAATSTGESKQIALSILKDFSKRKELYY